MSALDTLLANNRTWAAGLAAQQPQFFEELAQGQQPSCLWIGCSDSRAPVSAMVQAGPGELFVHRNIANQVQGGDDSAAAVIEYGVGVLGVQHVIVCGHYGCGGLKAALAGGASDETAVGRWLNDACALVAEENRALSQLEGESQLNALAELNVIRQLRYIQQMEVIQSAMQSRGLRLHGWVYALDSGLINPICDEITTAEQAINRL